MDNDAIRSHANLEADYWWFVGRRRVIQTVLRRYIGGTSLSILDWGCGPGENFPILQEFGRTLGVDASAESIRYCHERGFSTVIQAATLQEMPAHDCFDLVTAFDVLEHIPDDEDFLKQARLHLRPGGYVMLTVPAYQFLWSELDDILGHVRRYTRRALVERMRACGYEVVKASYFICAMTLPVILYRFLGKVSGRSKTPRFSVVKFPQPLNTIFTWLVFLEAQVLRCANLPFGTSIVVVAKRVEDAGCEVAMASGDQQSGHDHSR